MRPLKIVTIFGILAIAACENGPSHGKIVVCSVAAEPSLGFFKASGNRFEIESVDLNLCTHLTYAYMDASKKPWDSMDSFKEANYKQLADLRKKYPHLKVSLGIIQSSDEHFKMATGRETRKAFIDTALNFTLAHGFNGLELTWSFDNDQPFANERFAKYAAVLMEKFQSHNLLLTSMFVKMKMGPSQPHDLLAFSKYFDFMLIAPNYIDGLIRMGVASSKIVIKTEFMGRGRISPDSIHKTLGYNEVCEMLSSNGESKWVQYYDHEVKAKIAKRENGIGKQMDVIVFPSSRTIANEMRYFVRRELAGALAYTLNVDDYLGKCGMDDDTFNDFRTISGVTLKIPMRHNTTFPLLRTMNDAILVAIDEFTQETNIMQQPHYFRF
ncbi:probable chitinase 2 [Sitodiplosis mosellana]|uniref:probable chitinase 2 n=1 Tax=Sitodiplosis mosellana TaxID=263140 RepID=UPI002444AEDC|nr:probable chitinase 2 [Sitodiplosis mosellana]